MYDSAGGSHYRSTGRVCPDPPSSIATQNSNCSPTAFTLTRRNWVGGDGRWRPGTCALVHEAVRDHVDASWGQPPSVRVDRPPIVRDGTGTTRSRRSSQRATRRERPISDHRIAGYGRHTHSSPRPTRPSRRSDASRGTNPAQSQLPNDVHDPRYYKTERIVDRLSGSGRRRLLRANRLLPEFCRPVQSPRRAYRRNEAPEPHQPAASRRTGAIAVRSDSPARSSPRVRRRRSVAGCPP